MMQQQQTRAGLWKNCRIKPRQIEVIDALIDKSVNTSDGPSIQPQEIDTDPPALTEHLNNVPVKPAGTFIRKYASARRAAPSNLVESDERFECGSHLGRTRCPRVRHQSGPLKALELALQGIPPGPSKPGSIGLDIARQPNHRTAGASYLLSDLACLRKQAIPQIDRGRLGRHLRKHENIPLGSHTVEQITVEALKQGMLVTFVHNDIEVGRADGFAAQKPQLTNWDQTLHPASVEVERRNPGQTFVI